MFTFQQWLNDFLVKAAGHKYIKRIPYQSGGRVRYRYIYNVTHTHAGKHVLDPDHMKVGTKLMLDATSGKEVHGHITDVSGNKVTVELPNGKAHTVAAADCLPQSIEAGRGVRLASAKLWRMASSSAASSGSAPTG